MTSNQQMEQFADDLDRLVERARHEYDLTYAQVVGCLEMKKTTLVLETAKLTITDPGDDQ